MNWEEVVRHFLRGVQADAVADSTPETAGLLERLFAASGTPALSRALPLDQRQAPVLTIHFRHADISLRLFTTIATLGTPHGVTLQEIRIECFFPVDDTTAWMFQDWAAGRRPS